MGVDADLIGVEDASQLLHVSVQHVRRLADAGRLTKVARGLLDRESVERYQLEHRQARTRSWAEHTAWGAIALLGGYDAVWLGATQASRLRRTLRELVDPVELLVRTRERARVSTFRAHTAALPRLREVVTTADLGRLGIVDAAGDIRLDGYLPAEELQSTVRTLGLVNDSSGNVTLRATNFDFDVVRDVISSGHIEAALDAATSLDPRSRGVGERALAKALDTYR